MKLNKLRKVRETIRGGKIRDADLKEKVFMLE